MVFIEIGARMKKPLILLFIILLLCCQHSEWGEIRYLHSNTNVRKFKSTSSSIVKTLQSNEKVRVITSDNDWWLVYNVDAENKSRKNAIGYIHKSLLHSTPAQQKVTIKKPQEININTPKLDYTIVEREDISYLNTPRMVYRVVLNVDTIPDKILIEEVAVYLWDNLNKNKWLDFTVFLYLPEMNTNSRAYGIGEFTSVGKKSFQINEYALTDTKWADYVKQGESSSSTSLPAPQQTVNKPPTSQQTVNKPPTSKRYSQVADVIEECLSYEAHLQEVDDYIIILEWELKETTDWYHGKCWTQTIVYSMNGITNKCLFFIKKDLGGWVVAGWEIIE